MPKSKSTIDNRFSIALGTLKALKNNGIKSIHFPERFFENFKTEYSQFLKQEFSSVGFTNIGDTRLRTIEISIDDLIRIIDLKSQGEKPKLQVTLKQKQQAQQLYSQYLDTIFPDSKVKDVLYHGTTNNKLKVTGFTKEGVGTGFHRTPQIFLSFSRRYSSFFGNNILPVIINTINPDYIEFMAVDSVSSYVKTMNMARMDLTEEQWKAGNHEVDALIGIEAKTFSSYYEKYPEDEVKSVAVFSPKQIYPLGTKQDIERFKEFVGSVSNVQEAQPIIPINEMEDIIDNLPPFTKDIEDLGFTEEACDL